MKTITIIAAFVVACAFGDSLWHIGQDIHAIRETLDPHPISVGMDAPPFRARVDFREDSHQEPEVTLL